MDVLGDLVARERRRKEPLVHSAASQPYTAHKFCTDAWKTASLFRYHGVGPGRPVAIADEARPQTLLALFGAALLGSSARFGLPTDDADGPRLLVGDAADLDDMEPTPGTKRVGYDGPPDDPDVVHFERDIWSENPTMPPATVTPEQTVLDAESGSYTHEELLAVTDWVVAEFELSADDAVAIRAQLTNPGTVVAGVLAPLAVDAEIVLPGSANSGTFAVAATDETTAGRRIDPGQVGSEL